MNSVCKFAIFVFAVCFATSGIAVSPDLDSQFISLGSVPNVIAKEGAKAKVFFLSRISASWENAWFECRQALNGILAEIDSTEEDLFIQDSLIAHNYVQVWTSGTYESTAIGWIWGASGRPVNPGYQNWGPGQPQYNSTSYRLSAYRTGVTTYYWRTLSYSSSIQFVCQST